MEELPGKIRGQLRNARKVEAEVAALKISYLKRLNRGSRIVIIDSYDFLHLFPSLQTNASGQQTWIYCLHVVGACSDKKEMEMHFLCLNMS